MIDAGKQFVVCCRRSLLNFLQEHHMFLVRLKVRVDGEVGRYMLASMPLLQGK